MPMAVAGDEIIVFAGPTIGATDVAEVIDCCVEPPAQLGSIYRAVRGAPKVLAIIDGYYEHVPAVWHRELLWALLHGVWVYGGASMGALRAAELDAYGMRGVGRVYAAFRDGDLTDDDEVAVAHGPAASGHRPVSEAMVNIRATLDRAVADNVLPGDVAATFSGLAKARFYPDRDWETLAVDARAAGVDLSHVDALERFLRDGGRVDQKRLDAYELLRTIATDVSAGWQPQPPMFEWEDTSAWDLLRRTEASEPAPPD